MANTPSASAGNRLVKAGPAVSLPTGGFPSVLPPSPGGFMFLGSPPLGSPPLGSPPAAMLPPPEPLPPPFFDLSPPVDEMTTITIMIINATPPTPAPISSFLFGPLPPAFFFLPLSATSGLAGFLLFGLGVSSSVSAA